MSWKNLFIKQDDVVATESEQLKVKETIDVSTLSVTPVNTSSIGIQTASAGVVTEEFMEILCKKLDSLNVEGEDYYEYRKSLLSLKSIAGMTEQSIYVSAFASLSPRGLTNDIIDESAAFYISELKKENEVFKLSQSSKYNTDVDSIASEILAYEKISEERSEEILRLNEEILRLNNENAEELLLISEMSLIMNINKVNIEKRQNDFDSTISHFIMTIDNDITIKSKYINNTEK